MGFFDKVKKAFDSKKENVESQNSANDELINEQIFTESIENEEIQSKDSQETPANNELRDEASSDKNRNFKHLDDLIHSGVKEIVLVLNIISHNIRFKQSKSSKKRLKLKK